MPSPSFNSPPPSQTNSSMDTSENFYRSPQMRKEALRNVHFNVQALQSDVNTKTIENLETIISEVDTINQEGSLDEKIQNQCEVLLDSEIMTMSSKVIKKCSLSLSKNLNCYDPVEFADKLKNYLCRLPDTLRDEEPDFALLGNEIMKYFKRTSTFTILLGTLKVVPKKEVVKRRNIVREAQAPTKRPDNVISVEKVEDSVEYTVIEITKIISTYQKEHSKPLDFFALVLNPNNFGKTIENILHVSFLIRDGKVTFIIDENGIPQVYKSSKKLLAAEAASKKKKKNIQNVLSLTMAQWRALVEAYQIKSPMIDLSKKKN